ncbi:MAG: AAA family ATPase [Candidatus Puniceispirillaceae bacterium]
MSKIKSRTQTTAEQCTFSLRNFGPISSAREIQVKPLTIFFGPSNSGKTIFASMIYAYLLAQRATCRGVMFPSPEIQQKNSNKLVSPIMEEITTNLYKGTLIKLRKCLSVNKLTELIAKPRKRASTVIYVKNEGLDSTFKLRIGRQTQSKQTFGQYTPKGFQKIKDVLSPLGVRKAPKLTQRQRNLARSITRFSKAGIHFFPAGRSGLVKGKEAIFVAYVRASANNTLRAMPGADGITADFFEKLQYLDTPDELRSDINVLFRALKMKHSPPLEEFGDRFETELLDGEIELEPQISSSKTSNINYKQKGHTIPLNRASSMITELGILVPFFRNIISIGDAVIIEEPEAHLHPAAQVTLGNLLSDLTKEGVTVIITTHSPILIEQISNNVSASRLKTPMGNVSPIDQNDVAVYEFSKRQEQSGSIIREILFVPMLGIFDIHQFSDVFDRQLNTSNQILDSTNE